jgi:hypothetical protein
MPAALRAIPQTGEFPNPALPWLFLTITPFLYCTWGLVTAVVFLVPLPPSHLALFEDLVVVLVAPAGWAGLWAWLLAYRAPKTLVIAESGVSGMIRFSPLKRFTPRRVEIPFDRIRRVYFSFPGWAVRSKSLTGGVWFIYLSRENARRVNDAWDRWRALSAPFTASG